MKRFPFIFIFCLSLITPSFLQAQDDLENEYAYGTITNITDKEILLKEYNYEKEEFVEITYQLMPETKVRNTDSIKSILNGNQIEILYQDVDGKKNALVVVLETEEGVVEQDNPEKAAADAAAPATDAATATPATTTPSAVETPAAAAPAVPAAPAEQTAPAAPVTPAVETAPQAVTEPAAASETTPSPAALATPPPQENAPAPADETAVPETTDSAFPETTTEAAPAEESEEAEETPVAAEEQ